MTDLGDRLLIMIVAATGLAVLFVGWAGGLAESALAGTTETVVLSVLGAAFLLVLAGAWREFGRTE